MGFTDKKIAASGSSYIGMVYILQELPEAAIF
jgi:hypothetical protein